MKQWILNTFFKEELHNLFENAKREGSIDAFTKAHADIRETMKDDLDERAEELAKSKLSQLLNVVDWSKVVTLDKAKGIVFIGGQRIDEGRLMNLKQEAEALMGFDLWQLIYETPKGLAEKAMFVAGDSVDDMKKGRSILFTLSSQKNIVDLFNGYKPK